MNSIIRLKNAQARFPGRTLNLFLLLVLFITFLSGCSKYQYMLVNSYLYQNDNKEFINENDTVLIKYSFSGENFPVKITIYNKLSQPLYIDLTRSTVVINNIQFNQPFYRDGQISYIVPQSSATITSNPLKDKFVKLNLNDSLVNEVTLNNLGTNYSFSETTSPLFFRVILALTTNEDNSYPTFFDYSFWISDVLETMTGPKSLSYTPSNQFYIKKNTAFGKTMVWTGAISLLILGSYALSGE